MSNAILHCEFNKYNEVIDHFCSFCVVFQTQAVFPSDPGDNWCSSGSCLLHSSNYRSRFGEYLKFRWYIYSTVSILFSNVSSVYVKILYSHNAAKSHGQSWVIIMHDRPIRQSLDEMHLARHTATISEWFTCWSEGTQCVISGKNGTGKDSWQCYWKGDLDSNSFRRISFIYNTDNLIACIPSH